MQAALKTIGEEDKYFSKVSLRLESTFIIVPFTNGPFLLKWFELYVLNCPSPILGCHLLELQLNLPI